MQTEFNDDERLVILEEYGLNERDLRITFEKLTAFGAQLCETPICLVSVVERDRQRFLSPFGLDATGTPRSASFCSHAMHGDDIMVVPDATLDPRFADNVLVTGEPNIRFYAGAPLRSEEGAALGALCVIDRSPRAGLSELQRAGLLTLAEHVSTRLNLRRAERARAADGLSARRALEEHDQRFRVLSDTMPQMVWSTLPDGFHDYYNARWYEFTGMPVGSTDGEGWAGMFHPEDQSLAWSRWRHSLETGAPYEVEYRLRNAAGDYRWTLGRALPIRDAGGQIVRWFGTCTDIHEQKLLMEQREMVSHELSHRIKNIFSIIAGMISLASRNWPAGREAAMDLRERVIALGRAHDFVRPHSPASQPTAQATTLTGMLEQVFKPYGSDGAPLIRISGDDPRIDDRAATPLALIFHELATNAVKYGALSQPGGGVSLTITEGPDVLSLRWTESGGPRVSEAPAHQGFGGQLLDMSATRQLGGVLSREWRPEGLVVDLAIPASAIRRPGPQTG